MKRWTVYFKNSLQIIFITLLIGYLLPSNPISPVVEENIIKIDPASFWHYPWSDLRVHKGIDIFCKSQCIVVAPITGIILKRGYGSISGNYIYLLGLHWKVYYIAHLDTIILHGLFVKKGRIIGIAGNTGNAIGKPTHAHISIQTILPYFWRFDKQSPEGWLKMFYLNPISEIKFPHKKVFEDPHNY